MINNKAIYPNWKQNEIIRPISLAIYLFILIISVIFFISSIFQPVTAISITTDEITETSIVWNLSELSGLTIITISFDGISLNGYTPNVTRVVQNNLFDSETHIITVIDSLGNKYEASAQTLPTSRNAEDINGFIFGMIYLVIAIVILFAASRLPVLGFISAIFCVIGIIKGIQDTSFLSFLLYVITLIISLYVTTERIKN